MRQAPIYSQIKRGKLGADNILIVFAVIGSLLLPFIIYERFRNNRSTIVKNRGINPRVIENLDEDSPISLDAVSQQSIMYENPDRVKQIQKKKEIAQSISKM